MEPNPQSKKPSKITIANAVLILVFALLNLILSYRAMHAPLDRSEFGALHNLGVLISLMLVLALTLLSILGGLFMLKLKRWALFLSFICIALIIPVLAVSNLEEVIFELSPGAPLSLNHEILPGIMLFMLLFSWKDFRKKA
ncbi:MAG: hypothetical protein IPG07_09010 [Crocinitomicaceae bacterium]|nr:hypothetical protein [Crocinitomicaceae bacterium]MBK6953664.1 hypothetical protein [Crocinitomicaceae bacterium]